jgi:hypothetical protein
MALEEEFGMNIPDEEAEKLHERRRMSSNILKKIPRSNFFSIMGSSVINEVLCCPFVLLWETPGMIGE